MSTAPPIDLSQLTAPDVVEALSFEDIFAAMLADLQARDPVFDTWLESDPAYKILEVAAYREVLLRQRVNDAARQVMLAFAAGTNLDQLAALYGIIRLASETDTALRTRVQLAPEALSVAGPTGAYRFHALSASPDVADVSVDSPSPGMVRVTVLAGPAVGTGDGTPDQTLLDTVAAALDDENVRPLTDTVLVAPAAIITYQVTAALTLDPGPDSEVVRAAALAAVTAYAAAQHKLGRDITRAALTGALVVPGVQNVSLLTPAADIVITQAEVPYASAITVTVTGTAT